MVTLYKYHDSGLDLPKRPPSSPLISSPQERTAYAKDFVDVFAGDKGSYYGIWGLCDSIHQQVFSRELGEDFLETHGGKLLRLRLNPLFIKRDLHVPAPQPPFMLIDGIESGEIYNGSHAVAIKIDFRNKVIEYQDSHGIGMPYPAECAFLEKFSGFTVKNYGLRQQGSDHACALYALLNLLRFAQDLPPIKYSQEDLVNIRKDHADIVLGAVASVIRGQVEHAFLRRVLTAITERDEHIEVPSNHQYKFVPDLIRLQKTTIIPPRTRNLFGKPESSLQP